MTKKFLSISNLILMVYTFFFQFKKYVTWMKRRKETIAMRTIFAEENNICGREENYIFFKRITNPRRTVWQGNSRFRRIPAISWKKYSERKFFGFSSAFRPSSCSSLWDTAGSCRIVPRSSRPEYCFHFSSISVRFRSFTEIGTILLRIKTKNWWRNSVIFENIKNLHL